MRFLIQFGFGSDERVRAAIDWITSHQRDDGMWHCGRPDSPGCLRASLDVLRVAVLDDELRSAPGITKAAEAVTSLLMRRGMARYHVKRSWQTLEYPYFNYSVICALDGLISLGYGLERPEVGSAMDYLMSRRTPQGTWTLDHTARPGPLDVGPEAVPHKWLTLDALVVAKRYDAALADQGA